MTALKKAEATAETISLLCSTWQKETQALVGKKDEENGIKVSDLASMLIYAKFIGSREGEVSGNHKTTLMERWRMIVSHSKSLLCCRAGVPPELL